MRAVAAVVLAGLLALATVPGDEFHFTILGDRTGEAQPGVFEEAVHEATASHPAFIITVGDAIEGGTDAQTDSQWQAVLASIGRSGGGAGRIETPIFFTPGNHDVWGDSSALAFERYTNHPLHYSFDYGQAHFTILDNSRTEAFSPEELAFLEKDLAAHAGQPLKFVFSHRPSWILPALLGAQHSIYQNLAEKYHVQYFIAGHIHQMLYFRVSGANYLCMPSAGGHLRDNKRYESGWFFGETEVLVRGNQASFSVHELAKPFGEQRVTRPDEWGAAGLVARNSVAAAGRP